jgi:hypothetical protein
MEEIIRIVFHSLTAIAGWEFGKYLLRRYRNV